MKPDADRNAAQAALAGAGQWWRALPPRERRLALLAGGVLLAFLLWTLAIQPAWRILASAPAELDQLESQLQGMQRLAGEVTQLRATPPVNAELAAAALKAATERLGEQAKLSLQGERAVLTVNGVATSALRDWLAEARSGARARPVEANLLRSGPGLSGTLVLSLGGGL
jgi:general secretion pathway protein M